MEQQQQASEEKDSQLGTLILLHSSSSSEQDLIKNIPKPTTHPSDPLNWSEPFKWYVLTVSSLAGLIVNFVGIGPSIGLPAIADYLTGIPCHRHQQDVVGPDKEYERIRPQLGRRPVILISLGISTLAALGCALATRSYPTQMAARFFLGFGAGGIELYVPLIVIDLFFVHQRGIAMGLYSSFYYLGFSFGSIIFGTTMLTRDWSDSYYLSASILGALWLLTAITIPETIFKRPISDFHKKLPLDKCMRIWSGVVYTQESIPTIFSRLPGLVCFPAILWSILLWGFQLAFLITIIINIPKSYAVEPYSYTTIGSGYMSFAGILGALAGFVQGGPIVDYFTKILTRRNNGIFEPEMRLPAILPCLIFTPLGLLLYGLGLQYHLSWVSAPAALFFLNYSLTSTTSITLTYSIDILNPIATEVISTIILIRGVLTFLMTLDSRIGSTILDQENSLRFICLFLLSVYLQSVTIEPLLNYLSKVYPHQLVKSELSFTLAQAISSLLSSMSNLIMMSCRDGTPDESKATAPLLSVAGWEARFTKMKSFIRARRDTPPVIETRSQQKASSLMASGLRSGRIYEIVQTLGDPPGITVTDPVATAPSLSASGARPGQYIYKSSRHLGDPSGLTAAGVTLVERRYDFSALDDH
ncbi:hypothetical protein KEM48_012400 [Puccinia striiformis f. sp. tritici PST-130]|nr:hypothetical protein KEM48_012400 [Puccinia striiformis f. sp. tritici PST-130]